MMCALTISGVASFIVYRLTTGVQNRAKPVPSTQLVVAARDIEIGALIRESDLKIADWAGPLPKGSTAKKAVALNRGVTSAIYQGEPVTENRLAPAGSGGGLAATIPAGMRACAVKVNEVVGVAGFVTPGMRVDVLITGTPPGESTGAGPAVKTLLQNIEVLSAGSNIDKDKEGKPQQVQVVNLLVTPHQAEILSLAGNETRIQLILRNPMDTEITAPPGTSMSELFGGFKSPRPDRVSIAPPPHPFIGSAPPRQVDSAPLPSIESIEVLNGATHTTAKFVSQESGQ